MAGFFYYLCLMKLFGKIWILVMLASLAACNSRESQKMEAALEQAVAVYGDGNLEIEVDTALFIPGLSEASAYFASKKQYEKAALAALLNGYSEKDFDKEAAMQSFKEAEHYGELAQDSLTTARAEYWMGKMLFDENRNEETLLLFNASNDRIGMNCLDKAVVENGLGVTYIVLKQFDSAVSHLQNSLITARDHQLDDIELKTLNNFAVLHRIQGDYNKSLAYLRSALEKPWLDDAKRVYVYLNLGNAFMAMAEMDSAAFYCQQLESVLPAANINDATKVSAYGALLKFAKRLGNDALALQYLEQQTDALYELMRQQREQKVYRIQKQYDYEALRNAMNQKIIRRHRVISLFSALLLMFAVVIIILQYRHKQILKEEEEMKQQLEFLKDHLRQTDKPSALDNLVVSQLKAILVANRTMNRTKDQQNGWRPLVSEVMGGKEKPFEAARFAIEKAYPDLYSVILENHPDLSETEANVCVLSCFDLSNQEIAELLGLKTNTVNQHRSTLRKKLGLNSKNMGEQLRTHFSK